MKVHNNRPFRGNLVDVRDHIIEKVKKKKDKLIITCGGLEGSMIINWDEIDNKIVRKSQPMTSKYREEYRLITFENNENK